MKLEQFFHCFISFVESKKNKQNSAFTKFKEEEVKLSVISIVEKYSAKALPLLFRALEDSNSKIRRETVWLIGKIRKEAQQAVPLLIKLLEVEENQVRWRVAWALGNYGKNARQTI